MGARQKYNRGARDVVERSSVHSHIDANLKVRPCAPHTTDFNFTLIGIGKRENLSSYNQNLSSYNKKSGSEDDK